MPTSTPIFTQTPKRGYGQVTTQSTVLDAPSSNQVTVLTAGATGCRVFEITVQAQGTVAAGVVRIFVGASSTTGHLIDEFLVTAISASNTAVMYRLSRQYSNLLVEASALLIATTSITQTLGVTAFYADY